MFRKHFKFKKILFFVPLFLLMFCFNSPKSNDEKMQAIMVSIANILPYHYNPKLIDDAYSEEVFKKYINMIDPYKRYFLQSDIDEFSKYKTNLDDYLNQGDLFFYKMTIDRLYQRVDEVDKISQEILNNPINFDDDEEFVTDLKIKKFPKNRIEQYDEWKKYIKYSILQEMETLLSKEELQKEKKDSVIAHRLQDTIQLNILTPKEKRIKAKEEIKDLITHTFRRLKKRKKIDWFTLYMNSYTQVFDPHTSYFSPKDKEDFDANFRGKVIGIGAQIQEKRGNLFFGPLVVGAPAWKSKKITEGDKILKVKSSKREVPVNVVGMLVEEAVRLIRGEKGTEVVLTIQKKDGVVKEVKLIREEVAIEETFAKSLIVQSSGGNKYGFINLPSFNADFEDSKGRKASDDIKNELLKLKSQNVKGIILDLRNNGGGSLTEVVDIMGLFIDAGPVVQIKDGTGKINILKNRQKKVVWDGPLVIMQNEISASASEILAGAMQDYGRAVIVGSPHSFGKGTVQTFIELNSFLNSSDDFGSLKLTVQKFYRVTGNSTQLKGVDSDIPMKGFFSNTEIGEKHHENALSWDKISSASYQPINKVNVPILLKNSKLRLDEDTNYQLLIESVDWRDKLDKEQKIPLKESKFNNLMSERKAKIKKFKSLTKYNNGLMFKLHSDEEKRAKKEKDFSKKKENWIKSLKKDLYLEETVNIISEMILLEKAK